MLFGIGEGLGFIFWNMKIMPFPFIGGRVKPDILTENIAKNLHLQLTVKETSSTAKAWDNVKELIDNGKIVGLKLDCYHLEYFTNPIHFAGHYTAIYGYDNNNAFLVDTIQQGSEVKTSLKSLALARSEKGPMASKNMYYTLEKGNSEFDLETSIIKAIRNNCQDYLNPPISNIGYKGILKTSTEIIKWFKQSKDIENEFKSAAILMEKAGTGGALFRNLYRDFLQESYGILKKDKLRTGYEAFKGIAAHWTTVSGLFERVAETRDFSYILKASDLLKVIAKEEKDTMEVLSSI